jgi:hypothetical protein
VNETPIAVEMIVRIDKWDWITFKASAQQKKAISREEKQPTEWKKMLFRYSSNGGLICRIYGDLENYIKRANDTKNE